VHWTAESIAATVRDVYAPLLLLLHKDSGNNEADSAFRRCDLWRQSGVVQTVAALGRLDFRDWARALHLIERGNMDVSVEKRQQLSGLAAALNSDDGPGSVCHCPWLLL
jgi:hypothetical protein